MMDPKCLICDRPLYIEDLSTVKQRRIEILFNKKYSKQGQESSSSSKAYFSKGFTRDTGKYIRRRSVGENPQGRDF